MDRLSKAYEGCCLVIEGDVGYGLTKIRNPFVFWGALTKIISEWSIPVVFTINEEQSSQFIFSMAKKIQEEKKEKLSVRYKPKAYTLSQEQLYAVQGLPNVGPKLAERLLCKFGTVRKVFTASIKDLLGVKGLGKKKSREITLFLDALYMVGNSWSGNRRLK